MEHPGSALQISKNLQGFFFFLDNSGDLRGAYCGLVFKKCEHVIVISVSLYLKLQDSSLLSSRVLFTE